MKKPAALSGDEFGTHAIWNGFALARPFLIFPSEHNQTPAILILERELAVRSVGWTPKAIQGATSAKVAVPCGLQIRAPSQNEDG